MDSRIGLDYIVENKEYTAKLGSGERKKSYIIFWRKKKNLTNFLESI